MLAAFQHVNVFFLLPEAEFSISVMSWYLLFSLPFLLVSLVYFPKIFSCIMFTAKVVSLGQTAMESNIKITLFFVVLFPLNMKKKCFDRKNYRALENKVNHCGRMPEVDKWRDGNVSTTSAICFLCWEFFILRLHCSLSLCLISLLSLSHISLTLLFSLHCIFPMYTFSFSFLSLGLSPPLTHSAFSVRFYLWGVTGPGKLGVSWKKVS